MRKHFLLLFLMALLPLAVSAAQLKAIEALSPYYGLVPTIKVYGEGAAVLTPGDDYTFNGYFSGAACTEAQKLTEDQVKATPVGTQLWAKVTGKNGYEGTLTGTFEIKKMALTLKGTQGVTAITKVFGAEDPEETELDKLYAVTSVTDFATNDLTDTFDGKITFARDEGEDAGEYDIIATITDPALAANYSIASEDILVFDDPDWIQALFTITPKPINSGTVFADGFTCAPIAPVTYTGNQWKPAISLKDGAVDMVLGANAPAAAVRDFYVVYTDNVAASTTAKATITGTKNYSGSVTVNFTINAAPVLVKPVVKKVYDGSAVLPAVPTAAQGFVAVDQEDANADGIFTNKFVFQGIIDNTPLSTITFTPAKLDLASGGLKTTQKNVTANPVALKFAYANVDDDINDVFSLANYTFIAQDGTLEITQKALTAHADNTTINYGAAEVFGLIDDEDATTDPDDALTGGLADDVDALRGAIKVTKAAAAETEGLHAGDYKLTPEWRTDDEIAAVYAAVTPAATKTEKINAAKAARGNYKLTPAFGYLHYNKSNLYIGLKESAFTLEKVYDGEEVSLDDQLSKLENTSNLVFSGFQGTDDETKANILDLSELTMAVADKAADADDYTINLSGAKSDFYNIIYIGSTYKIKKKDLKIYIGDQTFVKGQVRNMNASLYTIDNEKRLAPTDEASEVFVLTTTVAVDGDNKVTSDPAGNPYQINAVDVDPGNSKYANYNVTTVNANDATKTYGIATVLAATAIVLDADADLTNLTGEDETKDAVVTFSSRNLKKGVWYTMALPFDITVRELSRLMGYVVVDKFVANATSSDMNFKIFMGTINAYEPFLIKCDQDVNLNEKNIAVTIKKYADCTDNMTQENASYYFKSNFKKQAIEEAFWTDGANMTAEQFKFNKYAAGSNLKAMRAYITAKEGVSAAPNIFIEEADGSTTAISTIDADGVAVEKTGWYTINGVKLEGVPTEKGVYINNGKKIVIK